MSDKTGIEWTDATWNPLRGTKGRWHCVRISGACKHCYAATMNHRFGGPDYVVGADTPRLDEKALTLPLRWREPRKVFVCSMTDLFLDAHADDWIDRIFAVMALAPRHAFQVLTKRPERMRRYLASRSKSAQFWKDAARTFGYALEYEPHQGPPISLVPFPLPNVWLGVSVEDQATADARVEELRRTRAAVRFISYEPALAAVDFEAAGAFLLDSERAGLADDPLAATLLGRAIEEGLGDGPRGIDWIIVGGESGPGARPFDVAWARSTIEQSKAAGVACFVKQLGARPFDSHDLRIGPPPMNLRDRKGGDPAEWPANLRVREFPSVAEVRK